MAKQKLKLTNVLNVADPRDVPVYTVAEAAHYLSMPAATLRSWVCGMESFKPVIKLPQKGVTLLSFLNLAEAHVLRALRDQHKVRLPIIRKALKFVQQKFGWERPLIQQQFKTDGVRLFVEHLGEVVDASAMGQLVIQSVLAHLDRIEWENDIAARLFPFTRENDATSPKSVLIDPRFSFGRPLLRDSKIPTAVIAERYKAGDSIDNLALDYGCSRLDIEEGVRCELRLQAAA